MEPKHHIRMLQLDDELGTLQFLNNSAFIY